MNLVLNPAVQFTLGALSLPSVECALATIPFEPFTADLSQPDAAWRCSRFINFSSQVTINKEVVFISGSYSEITQSMLIEAIDQTVSLSSGLSDVFDLIGVAPIITWPDGFSLDDIYLSNLRLLVGFEPNPTLQSVSFGVVWKTSWQFIPGKAVLEKICVGIWISDPFNSQTRQYGGQIYGQFQLGGVNGVTLNLYAQMPASGTNQGWQLSGSTYEGQTIPIGALLEDIDQKFGSPVTLPSALKSCQVQNLAITFDTGTSSFSFSAELIISFSLADLLIELGIMSKPPTNPLSSSSSSIGLTFIKTAAGTSTKLSIVIDGGVKLNELLDLSGDLPGFNPELKEIDFAVDVNSSGAGISSDYSYSAVFDNPDSDPVETIAIAGIYANSKQSDGAAISSFGGNLYSPGGNSINLGGSFPIQMGITDLFVAKISHTPVGGKTDSFTVFGSDLNVNGDIDLGSLPVVGDFLKEAKFSFNALRIVYANAQIKADELTGINGFLAQINVAPLLTPQSTVANNASTPASFAQGFSLQGSLVLGDNAEVIPLHSSFLSNAPATGSTSGATSTSATDTAATLPLDSSSPASPSPVGKKFGPVSIESVSLGLKGSKVCLTFSGGLLVDPLGLDFIGLEITSPVDKFSPSITLHGLGLNINKPPLTLDGLFVESTINLPATGGTTTSITGYSGSLTVGYKDYALTAMGSYAKLPDGVTSIFIYGFLGAPLGGLPAILMITGAAAGFGYNRAFNLPSPETINTFPLIQPVIPGNTLPVDFNAMNLDFMPQEGSFWGAVGIRVESFKMIESFVLLSIKFNVELEIDILGIATMQFPVPDASSSEPPLARIGIGLVARILPERGIVAVNGAFLPGSYVFNPSASITGGFAMLSVFKDQSDGQWSGANEGDFILTIGGYGPLYKPEAYYPQVSRLEMNWKVSDALSVKADAYFAITPQAMMAGGHLVANFQAGGDFSIQVVFTVGADFIIYWKPYRYLGHMYADLAVTARIDVSFWLFSIHASVDFDLSADLKIWGPSFSGYASVSVHVLVSFSVGISFGEDEQMPQPIGWDEFRSGFLPASDKILSANIGRGLIASQSSPAKESIPAINVVNAKELVVILGTAIPVKLVSENTGVKHANTSFGIKPMANTEDDFKSVLTLNVSKDGKDMSSDELSTHFTFEPITKNMPSALWQPADKDKPGKIPDNADSSLINDLLSGVRISAIGPVAGTSCTISANEEDIINIAPVTKGTSFSYGTGFSRAA